MADQSMKLNLIMGMVDNITAPIKKVTDQTRNMSDEMGKTQSELKRLGTVSKDIEHFKKLKQGSKETELAMQQAQDRVNALAREISATSSPTKKMTREFEQAKKAATKLKSQHQKEREELTAMSKELNKAGVATNQLDRATREIQAQTSKYNRQLKEQGSNLAEVAKRQAEMQRITDRNKQMRVDASLGAVGVGAAVLGVKKLVDAYGEVASAQGEIQSLGINDAGIKEITRQAKEFSSTWAGTTQAEFIRASYDIKSGISSLSDAAVGEFTKIAALTGGATKSTTAEMTSLFASGYAIYRDQFDQFGAKTIEGWEQLDQAARDMKFAEYFSAGISNSVQAFKTDGKEMAAAISNLGATATTANVSLEEQLSILGMLQASTGSGSEAATKYKAFLSGVGKAADKLGLDFRDANDNLRSMSEILNEIKAAYGDTLTDIEKQELIGAFGGNEAFSVVDLLYSKSSDLTENMKNMNQSLQGGLATTTKMATAILNGPAESFQLLNQRIGITTAEIGKAFAPTMVFAAGVVGMMASGVTNMMEQFPLLSNVIAITVTALIGLKAASIAAKFSYSLFSDALIFGRKVLQFLTVAQMKNNAALVVSKARTVASTVATWAATTAQRVQAMTLAIASKAQNLLSLATSKGILTNLRSNAVWAVSQVRVMASVAALWAMVGVQKAQAAGTAAVTAAQWAWNTAMMANPIGLVIAGIMALIAIVAVIIKYWEPISGFFAGLWDGVKAVFSSGWEFIKTVLSFTPLGLIMQAWEPLTEFFGGLWDGIKSVFAGALEFITGSVLAPINAVKETLGGWWDSLFGDDEKNVGINHKVKQITDGMPVMANSGESAAEDGVNSTRPMVKSASVGVSPMTGTKVENHFDYGGITIHASEGMSARDVALEVERKLRERDQAERRKHYGRLFDAGGLV